MGSHEALTDRAGLVVYSRLWGVDAIDEYSKRLVSALRDSGVPVSYVADGLPSARMQVADPAWILVQYSAFSYGRWGVAPGLLADAITFRRRTGAPLAVTVHESWVDANDRARGGWRSSLMGVYQRAQLFALLRVADVVIATTQEIASKVGRDARHVPVGSNITPLAVSRDEARRRLGLGDELVVSLFGTGHPSRALEYATAAIQRLAASRGPQAVRVLNLGQGAPSLRVPPEVHVDSPGLLDADDVSVRLRASDLLLLPFADGVSTRRTTLMAGLAHGLPVVSLHDSGTDDVLRNPPEALTLTPLGDIEAFVRATLELASDPDRMRTVGESARELYAREFDWPVKARQVAAALRGGRRSTTQA